MRYPFHKKGEDIMLKHISTKTTVLGVLFALVYLPFYVIIALTGRYR